MKRIPPKENAGLCLAPWTHTFISPQSERRICCASREQSVFTHQYLDQRNGTTTQDYNPLSLEEHWNGEYMKSVRLRMMSGEKLPECEVCHDKILTLNTYKDYFTQNLFPHLMDEIYEKTDDTGFTTMKPKSFDYRITNGCNFKCRMCGDQLSSAWEEEKRENGLLFPEHDQWVRPEMKEKISHFTKNTVITEFEAAIERDEVEEIYWVGGEPLVWAKHWDIMDRIITRKAGGNIFVRYNTNLSIIKWKEKHLFHDILPHFKGYNISASIDGCGKIGEFIRTGLNWESWLENFKSGIPYIKERGANSLIMDVTLTLPGLFGIVDLLKVARELDVGMYVKITFGLDPSTLMSPFALPRKVLDPILNDLMLQVYPLVDHKTIEVLNTLKEMKNRPTFEEKFPNWKKGFNEGRDFQQRIAKIRNDGLDGRLSFEEIFSKNQAVLDWWNQKLE